MFEDNAASFLWRDSAECSDILERYTYALVKQTPGSLWIWRSQRGADVAVRAVHAWVKETLKICFEFTFRSLLLTVLKVFHAPMRGHGQTFSVAAIHTVMLVRTFSVDSSFLLFLKNQNVHKVADVFCSSYLSVSMPEYVYSCDRKDSAKCQYCGIFLVLLLLFVWHLLMGRNFPKLCWYLSLYLRCRHVKSYLLLATFQYRSVACRFAWAVAMPYTTLLCYGSSQQKTDTQYPDEGIMSDFVAAGQNYRRCGFQCRLVTHYIPAVRRTCLQIASTCRFLSAWPLVHPFFR